MSKFCLWLDYLSSSQLYNPAIFVSPKVAGIEGVHCIMFEVNKSSYSSSCRQQCDCCAIITLVKHLDPTLATTCVSSLDGVLGMNHRVVGRYINSHFMKQCAVLYLALPNFCEHIRQ